MVVFGLRRPKMILAWDGPRELARGRLGAGGCALPPWITEAGGPAPRWRGGEVERWAMVRSGAIDPRGVPEIALRRIIQERAR